MCSDLVLDKPYFLQIAEEKVSRFSMDFYLLINDGLGFNFVKEYV